MFSLHSFSSAFLFTCAVDGSRRGNPSSVVAASHVPGASSLVFPGLVPPLVASHCCPDPEGLDAPAYFLGGSCFFGQACFSTQHGGHFALGSSVVHPPPASFGLGFSSSASTVKQWCTFTFPGDILAAVPSFAFGSNAWTAPPPHGGYPHAPALVGATPPPRGGYPHAPTSVVSVPPSSLASDITMSFVPPDTPLPVGAPSPGAVLVASPLAPVPAASPLFLALSPPLAALLQAAEPFKLAEIKDAKTYLNLQDLIQ